MIFLIIDNHESKSTIARMRYLFESFGLPIEVKEITVDGEQVADFANPPRWGVERKTLDDFWGSLKSKRIWLQADKLAKHFQYKGLAIIGGDLSDLLNQHPKKEEWIMSSLAKIEQQYDVRVKFFREEFLFGKWIFYLDRYNGTLPTPTYKYIKKQKNEVPVQVRILAQIDGISDKLAKRILEDFETIHDLARWVDKDPIDTEGIGPVKSENIRKALLEECSTLKKDPT